MRSFLLLFILIGCSYGAFAQAPEISFNRTTATVVEDTSFYTTFIEIINPDTTASSVDIQAVPGGSAVFASDFTFGPMTINFPASSSSPVTLIVAIVNDGVAEPTETFTLRLANPSAGVQIGADSLHTVTVLDDDQFTVGFVLPNQSRNEGSGSAPILIELSDTSANPTVVDLSFYPGLSTATGGSDLTFSTTSVYFPPGQTLRLVNIFIIDDTEIELPETIYMKLSNPTNGAMLSGDSVHIVTIEDNDTLPSGPCKDIFFSEYIEGSAGNQAIELYNPTDSAVDLSEYRLHRYDNGSPSVSAFLNLFGTIAPGDVFVIANGAADTSITNEADLTSAIAFFNGNDALHLTHYSDTIDVIGQRGENPGEFWLVDGGGSTKNFTLVRNPYVYEGTHDWSLGATQWLKLPTDFSDSLGFHNTAPCGFIPPVDIAFEEDTIFYTEGMGNVEVPISFMGTAVIAVEVELAADTAASTAKQPADYNFLSAHIVHDPEDSSRYIASFLIKDDLLIEDTEYLLLKLRDPLNGTLLEDSLCYIQILDNDVLEVGFLGASNSMPEGDTTAVFWVELAALSENPTSVDVTYSGGDASLGSDCSFADTTLTFFPADTNVIPLPIQVFEDAIDEVNEQIIVELSNPTNGAVLGITKYTLFIVDNDTTALSVYEEEDNGWLLGPNPASDYLLIRSEVPLEHFKLYNAYGQLLMYREFTTELIVRLPLPELSTGIYVAELKLFDGVFRKGILISQ